MNAPMRRAAQQTSDAEAVNILNAATSGVLSLVDPDGQPYGVPMSFAYEDGKIYFHCAGQGQKLTAIQQNPKASFCVIAQDQVMPQEFTTYFKSAIAKGTIRVLSDHEEKVHALFLIAHRYWPENNMVDTMKTVNEGVKRTTLLELKVETLTGKVAKELLD